MNTTEEGLAGQSQPENAPVSRAAQSGAKTAVKPDGHGSPAAKAPAKRAPRRASAAKASAADTKTETKAARTKSAGRKRASSSASAAGAESTPLEGTLEATTEQTPAGQESAEQAPVKKKPVRKPRTSSTSKKNAEDKNTEDAALASQSDPDSLTAQTSSAPMLVTGETTAESGSGEDEKPRRAARQRSGSGTRAARGKKTPVSAAEPGVVENTATVEATSTPEAETEQGSADPASADQIPAGQISADQAPVKKKPVRKPRTSKKSADSISASSASESATAPESVTAGVEQKPAAAQEQSPAQPENAEQANTEKESTLSAPTLFSDASGADSLNVLFQAPDLTTVSAKVLSSRTEPAGTADEQEQSEGRRARRRSDKNRGTASSAQGGLEDTDSEQDSKQENRKRKSKKRGANQESGEGSAISGHSQELSTSDSSEASGGSQSSNAPGERTNSSTGPETAPENTLKRRRRRRRGDADLELVGGLDEDPPGTITKIRAPRVHSESIEDQVVGVKGSTRLEAKRQRRRDSRETGRRRNPISEAEFLARRESVDRQMIVRQNNDRIQIGVLEDGVLAEHFVSNTQQDSLIGNVYLGKVQNVLPSMEAAFVDIGKGRNAVLYAGEVNWDLAQLDGKPRKIESALKSGDSVLVQVTKDPVGQKGARLTSQISLPGRYLVYVPGGSMTGISRKLPDVERTRLKKILKDHLPEDAGVIVRTAAEGASEEELTNDINRLRAQWEGIQAQANSRKTLAPELLHSEPDLTIKVVRDVFNEDFSKLVVQGEDAWDTIEAYVTYVAPDLLDRLEKWSGEKDIFDEKRIDEQIQKALERKVYLPSGGSLVIDRTEAMTVVDVNTGKFTGTGGNLEETVTKNNLEAAEEVVRQLRLRDIGGIIVIDFIDMVLESNRDLVLRRLVECLGRDRTKHQVAEVTSLGLVQMTRKRIGTGLLEVFGEQCEQCAGRGVVTHHEPLAHPGKQFVHEPAPQRNEKAPRSERRKNKRHQLSAPEAPGASGSAPHTETDSPVERAHTGALNGTESSAADSAKAEAARAALANIAAAMQPGKASTAKTEAPAAAEVPVITFAGEAVEIPRGKPGRDAGLPEEPTEQAKALTLESLDAVFGANTEHHGATASSPAAPEAQVPQQASQASAESGAQPDARAPRAEAQAQPSSQRKRRPRRAGAPQGAPASITKEGADTSGASTRSASAASAQPQSESSAPSTSASESPAPELAQPSVKETGAQQGTAEAVASNGSRGGQPARRARRKRVATSAQGNAETAQVQSTEVSEQDATKHHSVAAAAATSEPAQAPRRAAAEPVVLGVGVPASEL